MQNKLIGEFYNELLKELEKAGESALEDGELIDLETNNTTLYIEFSEDSKVEVAKALGLNRELGSNILKIGMMQLRLKVRKEV